MRIIPILVLTAASLAACGADGSAGDGRPTVVAGFYPLAEAAGRAGGDAVEVVNLTPPGVEPHDLELTTRQVDRIEDAALVILLGGGFQPALEEAAERRSGPTLLVLDALELDDHGDEEADDDGHGHGDGDPHVWLDPSAMVEVAEVIAAALAEAVPDDEAAIRDRVAGYVEELRALDGRFEAGLAGCERDTFVTAHAAFGWLADRYDLSQESIAGLAPEQEPDPRRLAELADLVEREGITTVFTEELVSPRVARALAREAGVETDVLDPIEGIPEDRLDEGDDYLTVMDRNLERLRAALGCP